MRKPRYRQVNHQELRPGDTICVPDAVGQTALQGAFKRLQVLDGGNRVLINGWSFPLNGRYKFYKRIN